MPRYNQNRSVVITVAPAVEPVTVSDVKAFLSITGDDDDYLIENTIIPAARVAAERYTNRSFIHTRFIQRQNAFEFNGLGNYSIHNQLAYNQDLSSIRSGSGYIQLMKPLNPVEYSIFSDESGALFADEDGNFFADGSGSIINLTTYNSANVATVYSTDNYFIDSGSSRIIFNDTATLPSDLRDHAAIEIDYIAGFGDTAADVPADIKLALLMHIQSLYDFNRTNNVEFVVSSTPYAIPDAAKAIYDLYRLRLTLNG